MLTPKETINSLWQKVCMLCAILCIASISASIVTLHYAETIENDGHPICRRDFCKDSKGNDTDNDNETIRVLAECVTAVTWQLIIPLPSTLTILLPDYKNSYLFSFNSELIKPPILLA